MASMSAAPTATALTPPSSSHESGYPWNISSTGQTENLKHEKISPTIDAASQFPRSPLRSQTGNTIAAGESHDASLKKSNGPTAYASPPYELEQKQSSMKETAGASNDDPEPHGRGRSGAGGISNKRSTNELYKNNEDEDSSKWIHRDKLARIESEELQAAGIVLPRARARSKARPSQERLNGHKKAPDGAEPPVTRSRKDSAVTAEPKTPEISRVPSWDLRLPDEVEADTSAYWASLSNASSRIPVAKTSPLPIPLEHLERDTPMIRKRENSPGEDNSISYPKTRARSGSMKDSAVFPAVSPAKRSATDVSPRKTTGSTTAARKSSAPVKSSAPTGRPKTRGGPNKDSTSSSGGTRPSTRSGERELSPGAVSAKQPEGEPPWMVSAYRPDPRLPPDQQLLPTVARRLQQEKWEREGKFGNVYDREFRPLTDEGFLSPPEGEPSQAAVMEAEKPDEWPLKTEARSPTLNPGRTGSYSTIPKIQEKPAMSPLASPRPMTQGQPSPVVRVPDQQEEPKEKGGCGCCLVM